MPTKVVEHAAMTGMNDDDTQTYMHMVHIASYTRFIYSKLLHYQYSYVTTYMCFSILVGSVVYNARDDHQLSIIS